MGGGRVHQDGNAISAVCLEGFALPLVSDWAPLLSVEENFTDSGREEAANTKPPGSG